MTHSLLSAQESQSLSFSQSRFKEGELRGFQTVGVGKRDYRDIFLDFFFEKFALPLNSTENDTKNDTKNLRMGGGFQPPDHALPAEPLTMVLQGSSKKSL